MLCVLILTGTPSSLNTNRSRPHHRKRNVATEKGAEGLDPEYLFTTHDFRPDTRQSASTKGTFFTSNLSDDGM